MSTDAVITGYSTRDFRGRVGDAEALVDRTATRQRRTLVSKSRR